MTHNKEAAQSERDSSGDWPGDSEPGGCECMDCGRIFIGSEWRAKCKPCSAPLVAPDQQSRGVFHDQAWENYHAKAKDDPMLQAISAHQFRAIINAVFDAGGAQ